MGMQVSQHDDAGFTFTAREYNEVWTVMDEENYRREFCERLDIHTLQLDDDGIPFDF